MPRKKKLRGTLESVEELLKGIQSDLDAIDAKIIKLPEEERAAAVLLSADTKDGLIARKLQAERLRAHVTLQDKKLSVSYRSSAEWREDSAALVKEIAKCTCGCRERILELLEG